MKKAELIGGCLISVLGYLALSYGIDRSQFYVLIFIWAILFLAYARIVSKFEYNQLWRMSILFRVVFVFSLPVLSDDYFRFIWDGELIGLGENPFWHTPQYYAEHELFPEQLTPYLYENSNSPTYYSIYPPICQAIFYVSTLIGGGKILLSVGVMRIFLLFADLITIKVGTKLLEHFKLDKRNVFWYALNPLVIVEMVGNLHFEGLMIMFLCLAIYLMVKHRLGLSALAMACAVCTKLIPLMFLPLLLPYLKWKPAFKYWFITGTVILLLFAPFLDKQLIDHFADSVELYFQKFEFNASIYYVIRWVGYQIYGYNIIGTAGKILPLVVISFILIRTFYKNDGSLTRFIQNASYAMLVYLLCASIVHPWYTSMLVFFSVFTKQKHAVVWSLVAIVSYWAYTNSDYKENLWLVAFEYMLLMAAIVYDVYFLRVKTKEL